MLEQHLIESCSPTLASLMIANLFDLPYTSRKNCLIVLICTAKTDECLI